MSKTKVGSGGGAEEETVAVEVGKLANSMRRIRCRVSITASLETIWSILIDYDKLSDVIPSFVESKLVAKRDNNCSRVHQVVRQNLPLGLKFTAKMILDFYEKEQESLANGIKRVIEFKIVEGDFQSYEGTWSIEQQLKKSSSSSGESGEGDDKKDEKVESTLTYLVDLKPKPWLPFHLVEGRLVNMMKTNLACLRREAEKRTIAKTQVN